MMSNDCFHSTECLLYDFLRAEVSKGYYFGLRRGLKGYSRGKKHGLTIAYFWEGFGAPEGQKKNNSYFE